MSVYYAIILHVNYPVRSYSKIDSCGWDHPRRRRHPPAPAANIPAQHNCLPAFPPDRTHPTLPDCLFPRVVHFTSVSRHAHQIRPCDPHEHDRRYVPPAGPARAVYPLPSRALTRSSSLSPDDLRAEIAFREQAHAIASRSSLSSANVHPDDTSIGHPDQGDDALPPLVSSIQPGTIASFSLRFRHAEAYISSEQCSSDTWRTLYIHSWDRGSISGFRTQR